MRTTEHAKAFVSAKAKRARGLLYRSISRRKNRAVRQALQLHVRFAEHDKSLEYLKKLL